MAPFASPPGTGLRLGRRELLLGSVAAGFALAVRPVAASTVTTPDRGLTAGWVSVPAADGAVKAYRARPAKGSGFPVVLVVQEIFGVHAYIQDVCRRLAQLGYLAIAPSLFDRQGDVTVLPDIAAILPLVATVPDAQVMADLDATAAWVAASGEGDGSRLGITGFCWGGRITWLYAAHNPKLKAGVAWYGRLVGTASERQPLFPIDVIAKLKAPVLGLYAGNDDGIPMESVQRMQAALKAAGSPSRIEVFPGAPHGFHADYRPTYREAAAAAGWTRMQAWFRANGVV
ncbi:dienelactone hydrolase family protein [Synechococcus sp. BA-132 BA5]|uniref:dienelactone hydrolase family protein n=1 Tax=Synechococcus sp. BA-132 BA5 TaxID=3110252 RepID=UPI002B21C0E9|nr:dienelactone hydrolase family protein [Synechococcus sp. BA-132 BA5]MEA5415349.1 dienelactone hydrolase family protein [Synechococcus sp. BA-132 BA5]